ncbi:hypothetical protein J4Q44_G00183040 [Coregonus suidteri]|uniref:E3 ubiquitin-protein ligase RNF216 UBA domain-containing protein n=1 Tax=Coregonus suidteri TaxID=861788 RepID=A0AAN8LUP9_9TELE
MADGTDDDDVIHLASFNIHRSQGRRHRRRTFITISDDSDEEPVTLVPNSPAHDDDISILEPLTLARQRVIRPAALWGGASEGDGPIIELKEFEGHQTSGAVVRPHIQSQPRPSTSTLTQTRPQPQTRPVLQEVKLVLLPPVQTPVSLQQLHPGPLNQPRPRPPLQPHALLLTHAFQMQQPRALQPRPAPQRWPAGPCADLAPPVLIAAAPEPLGPPETGHRITLGSQTPGGPNPQPRASLLAHDRPLSLEPQVVVVVNRPATQHPLPDPALAVPQNPNPIVLAPDPPAAIPAPIAIAPAPDPPAAIPAPIAIAPAPVVPAPAPVVPAPAPVVPVPAPVVPAPAPVVPAPAPVVPVPAPVVPAPVVPAFVVPVPAPVVPRAAEERAGPSVLQEVQRPERPQLQPHVRALVRGVLDLFPDVQENYVAELIQTNDLKDLNVICNVLLENPAFPQRQSSSSASQTSILLEPSFNNTQGPVGPEVVMQAADLLMGDFRMISCQDIKWSLNAMKGHYAITRKVRGWVEEETMTIDFSIGENTTEGRTHMMCCENPKACQTQLTVLEYGSYDGDPVTKVLLQPLTGRTHQLRVHCEAVGHPIVGDYTYSLGADSAPYRMMLHAYLLHLPLEPLPLQAAAPDPFTTPTDPRWRPHHRLRTVEGAVESLLEHRALEERTQREERTEQEEKKKQREERRGRGRGREESEDQRRACQQWLSEWTDV